MKEHAKMEERKKTLCVCEYSSLLSKFLQTKANFLSVVDKICFISFARENVLR